MPARRDAHWDELFDRLVTFHHDCGHFDVPLDAGELGRWVRWQRGNAGAGRLRDDRRRRLEAIGFTFSVQSEAWEAAYGRLERFRREHGHTRVPRFTREYPGLGIWVGQQRVARREGDLSPERTSRLELLGFVWEVRTESWQQKLDQLAAFFAREGHGNVSRHSRQYRALGAWLGQQRHRYRTGRLSVARQRDLEARGVTFKREDPWLKHVAALAEFKREFGHCDVPTGRPLYDWVHRHRQALRRGTLSAERAHELRTLGLGPVPVVRHGQLPRWKRLFEGLSAFEAEHGHCRVTPKSGTHELWLFVGEQRSDKRKGLLPADREQLLDGIGFCWDPEAETWEEGFDELVAYHREHGHALGPFRLQYPSLSEWVMRVRRYYHQGTLDPARATRLEALGLPWVGERGRRRQDAELDAIREYRRTQGHFWVNNAPPYEKLYAWCERARREASLGKLEPRWLEGLRQLGFPFHQRELGWERWFAQLKSYRVRFGHLRVPSGELASWLSRQREAHRNESLSLDQEDRLEALGSFANTGR